MTCTRILVADAQLLFADALAIALSDQPEFHVCEQRTTSGVATIGAVEDDRPDIAVVDYWMQDMTGPAVLRAMRARVPTTAVVTVSWFHDSAHVEEALAAGARGFVAKGVGINELVTAIDRVRTNVTELSAEQLAAMRTRLDELRRTTDPVVQRFAELTPRQLEVLQTLAAGLTAGDVSRRLEISESTVRRHIHNVLAKVEARSAVEAVALARRHGVFW